MIIAEECEVDFTNRVNSTIEAGETGIIENDDGNYEVVYFTHCHYYGSNGRVSNTFSYRSFSSDGKLMPKEKEYLYKNIFKPIDKNAYDVEVRLVIK